MKKIFLVPALLSLSCFVFGQIVVKDYATDKEFTRGDNVKITVRQSVTGRTVTQEYIDEETRDKKTRRVSLPNLNSCGNSTFFYSEKEHFRLLMMGGCIDNDQAETYRVVFDLRIEAPGYPQFEIRLVSELNSPEVVNFTVGQNNPKTIRNVIYLRK